MRALDSYVSQVRLTALHTRYVLRVVKSLLKSDHTCTRWGFLIFGKKSFRKG